MSGLISAKAAESLVISRGWIDGYGDFERQILMFVVVIPFSTVLAGPRGGVGGHLVIEIYVILLKKCR